MNKWVTGVALLAVAAGGAGVGLYFGSAASVSMASTPVASEVTHERAEPEILPLTANDRPSAANPTLDSFLEFADSSLCEAGTALDRIRSDAWEHGYASVGPHKRIAAKKSGPDKDDVVRLALRTPGSWHGLPLRELRFAGVEDSGFGWMEFVFDAPAAKVGPVLHDLGFGVRKIGDNVDKELEGGNLFVSLAAEKGGTMLSCGILT